MAEADTIVSMEWRPYIPSEKMSVFSATCCPRMEPVLNSFSVESPLFVTTALTSEFPTISIFTSRGEARFSRSTDAPAAVATRADRPRMLKDFMFAVERESKERGCTTPEKGVGYRDKRPNEHTNTCGAVAHAASGRLIYQKPSDNTEGRVSHSLEAIRVGYQGATRYIIRGSGGKIDRIQKSSLDSSTPSRHLAPFHIALGPLAGVGNLPHGQWAGPSRLPNPSILSGCSSGSGDELSAFVSG